MTSIAQYDRAAAERRAERIRLRLDSIADSYTAVMPMIREAIEKRDDLALGYRSVSEYVGDRFGGALQRLGIEVRREVVRELTAAGMSTRAIAPVVGVTDRQVRRDAGGTYVPPGALEPSHVTGGFHPDSDRPTPITVNRVTGEVLNDAPQDTPPTTPQGDPVSRPVGGAQNDPEPAPSPVTQDAGTAVPRQSGSDPSPERGSADAPDLPPVIGRDGKTYPRRSTPRQPARRPLPEQFFQAAFDMCRAVERVARLSTDDRFPQNAEKVAAKHRNDLLRARDLLQQVIESLPTEQDSND